MRLDSQFCMKQISVLIAILCSTLVACATWPQHEFGSERPDKVLFDRAMNAVQGERYDVARITLQTLINTYPDSEYAEKARTALEDPRIAVCGDSWTSAPDCIDATSP